jgi:hypothetical protein
MPEGIPRGAASATLQAFLKTSVKMVNPPKKTQAREVHGPAEEGESLIFVMSV